MHCRTVRPVTGIVIALPPPLSPGSVCRSLYRGAQMHCVFFDEMSDNDRSVTVSARISGMCPGEPPEGHGFSESYKCVVKFQGINAVICIMERQRRNEYLVGQVVKRLKEIRQKRGLTQENVRFDTDLNIGRIESGLHSITLTTLADLCDYYQVTLEEFFHHIKTREAQGEESGA